jgi:hypothetical protein
LTINQRFWWTCGGRFPESGRDRPGVRPECRCVGQGAMRTHPTGLCSPSATHDTYKRLKPNNQPYSVLSFCFPEVSRALSIVRFGGRVGDSGAFEAGSRRHQRAPQGQQDAARSKASLNEMPETFVLSSMDRARVVASWHPSRGRSSAHTTFGTSPFGHQHESNSINQKSTMNIVLNEFRRR